MAKHFTNSSVPSTSNSQPLSGEETAEKTPSLKDSVPSLGDTDMYVALNEEQVRNNQKTEETVVSKPLEQQDNNVTVITPLDSSELEVQELNPEDKPKHHWWKIPAVIVGILALVYVGGAAFFNFYFMPQTSIYGVDYSLKPTSDLQKARDSEASNYSVHISGNGLDLTLKSSEIGLVYNSEAYARDAINQQNPWMWPVEITRSRTLNPHATATYDQNKVDTVLNQQIEQAKEASASLANGGITYDSATKKFRLADTALITRLSLEGVHKDLQGAFDKLNDTVVLGEESVLSAEELNAAIAAANAYVASVLDLTLGDASAYTVDADLIASWVTFNDDLSVSLNKNAISDWVEHTLAPAVNTRGTARTYKRWDGKEITTKAAGAYGWVINEADSASAIISALGNGQPTKVELPTEQQAKTFTKDGGPDWGGRYIDVDLSTQHAVLYDENGSILWEADVVTGLPDGRHNTPEGVWFITSHIRNARLLGPNDESGKPGWDARVDFWMGVKGQEVGFHNAPWRGAFGGDIYRYGGSHGCINLSYSDAEKLFNISNDGDPIIIHY